MSDKKIDIIDTNKALEMFGCSRKTFYTKYEGLLKQIPKIGVKRYYELEDVEKVIERISKPMSKYNIVE